MNTIDTRDLYTRKRELEELRDAVNSAKEELEEAKTALSPSSTLTGQTSPPTMRHGMMSVTN